jgi:hypothetical protein
MRVLDSLALGMVLAVNRRPLLGDHPRSQPQPEPEEVTGNGTQFKRAMRLMAVQEDGDTGNRDMGQRQGDEDISPPGKIKNSGVHAECLSGSGVARPQGDSMSILRPGVHRRSISETKIDLVGLKVEIQDYPVDK